MKNQMRVADTNFDRYQARQGLAAKNGSQMDKIVGTLQMGSKAGPTEEQVTAKAEARVKALIELKAKLQRATLAVSELYMSDKPTQMKKLTASLKKVKELADNKPPVGVKKHLTACINELTSLREGVYIGAATKKTLSIVACADAVAEIAVLIDQTKARVKQAKVESGAADDELYTEEVEKVIQRNAKDATRLESLKNRPFVISRVPIIPIATGLSTEALKRKGFKIETISNYVVMHNQLVIGINKEQLKLKREKEGKSIDTEKWQTAILKILRMISKQIGSKVVLVDEKPYGAQGGAWFWVMPEKELNAFASCFSSKTVKLQRFGFAF